MNTFSPSLSYRSRLTIASHPIARGYTLLELSVSLTVAALGIVAVIAGVTLIRQAEIRGVITEVGQLKSAIESFELKYNALPGDMDTASTTWSGATNGDGDRMIEGNASGSGSTENIKAWNHLSRAGLLVTTFTGTSAGAAPYCTIGTNVPGSKVQNAFYYLWSRDSTDPVFGKVGNFIHFGAISTSDQGAMGAIFTPNDAASLDTKVDDGIANTGDIYAADGNDSAGNCSAAYTSATGADYKKNTNNKGCRLFFWLDED